MLRKCNEDLIRSILGRDREVWELNAEGFYSKGSLSYDMTMVPGVH